MKRSEKDQIIAEVKEKIVRAKGMYFTDFTGITVEEITELRREFRKANIDYEVVKNTLARKALESVTGYDAVMAKLTLPTGIAFGYDDPIAPAKIIKKYREKNDKLKLKVCVVEKQVFDGAQLDQVAKFATRAETIAAILGSIQAPITGVAGAIHAVIRDLVSVIDAIEKKKAA
jgi:large subunit ribosomal protein L10